MGWAVGVLGGAPAASEGLRGRAESTRRVRPTRMPRLRSGGSRMAYRVRTDSAVLCVCRASMHTLLAGDTHARPPRGQTYVHQHVVSLCYFICVAWARPSASAQLSRRPGAGSPCPGRRGARGGPPADTPSIPPEAPRVSCVGSTTRGASGIAPTPLGDRSLMGVSRPSRVLGMSSTLPPPPRRTHDEHAD
jgi:hypothetical protein